VSHRPVPVIVAGAGIAGLETLLALRALAGDRVAITLVSPAETFVLDAAGVGTPFGHGRAPRHDVAAIAAAHDARLVRDALARVDLGDRAAITRGGEALPYEALVIAVGASRRIAFPEALTFRGARDVDAVAAAVRELEAGRFVSMAFVVPPGVTWPLPIYELALLTAAHTELYGLDAELTLITPEPAPLAAIGPDVADHLTRALARAGVTLLAATRAHDIDSCGAVRDDAGRVIVRPDRVVALPRLVGPGIDGLPADADGFLHVGDNGEVPGAPGVHGAGDATTSGLKHGGLAAQQAEIVAHAVAQRAGAPVAQITRRPVLRAQLLEGPRTTFLQASPGAPAAVLSEEALWWPPLKVAAPRLATYLASAGAAS
jgi:sulfide:quinone oxidoreductase